MSKRPLRIQKGTELNLSNDKIGSSFVKQSVEGNFGGSDDDTYTEESSIDSADDSTESETKYSKRKPRKVKRPKQEPKLSSNKQKRIYECDLCRKTYAQKSQLNRHKNQHTQTDILECEYCARTFFRKDKLNNHLRVHRKAVNDSKSPQVAQCFERYLYSKESLPTLNKCKLCDQNFLTISMLREHLKGHSDASSFNNEQLIKLREILKLDSKSLADFKTMVQFDISKEYFSPYYEIVNQFGLELTLSDFETDANHLSSNEDEVQPPYTCEWCKQSFPRKYEVYDHALKEHPSSTTRPYKCEDCELGFVCSNMFSSHERSHCRNEKKKYKCEHCPAKFMWLSNLENHKALCRAVIKETFEHREKSKTPTTDKDGEPSKDLSKDYESTSLKSDKLKTSNRRYQCQYCNESFAWPKELLRHRLTHLPGSANIQCHICQENFDSSDNMKAHLRTHTSSEINGSSAQKEDMWLPYGRKIIKCKLCNSEHAKPIDLKTHLLSHQFNLTFDGNASSIEEIFSQFYPEEAKPKKKLNKGTVIARIKSDIAEHNFERFYSISNELGYELGISSSETDTETEDNDSDIDEYSDQINIKDFEKYICELCGLCFNRKYKTFHHQNTEHKDETVPHACSHCDKKFIDRKLLEWHLKKQCENKKKRFVCKECHMRFMWEDNLEHHTLVSHNRDLVKSHASGKYYEWSQCYQKFSMQKDSASHSLKRRTSKKSIKCPLCPCDFNKERDLSLHINVHGISIKYLPLAKSIFQATLNRNGSKEIVCKNCDEKFKTITELRKHHEVKSCIPETNSDRTAGKSINYSITNALGFELDINDSESEVDEGDKNVENHEIDNSRPYACAVCSLSFKRKFEVAEHQYSTHKFEVLPLKCDKCIFKTVSLNILDHHKRTQCENIEKMHECDLCNFRFTWPENLTKHKELLHRNSKAAQRLTVFECNQCPRKYKHKNQLADHMKKMHPKISDVPKKRKNIEESKIQPAKESKKQSFLCSLCGRSLTTASDLTIHMRRHTGDKPFKCDLCDVAFTRSTDLGTHRRRHTGERPYPCTTCEKSFVKADKLKEHLRVHTGEKPYKCSYGDCDKRFAYSSGLKMHLRRHTGEKPFACEICGRSFIQGSDLRNHRNTHGHFEQEKKTRCESLLEKV